MQGDRRQLRGASGAQGPGLPESQQQQPRPEGAGIRGLTHVAAGREASQERLCRPAQPGTQLCQPANALHLQPAGRGQNPQTKSTISKEQIACKTYGADSKVDPKLQAPLSTLCTIITYTRSSCFRKHK